MSIASDTLLPIVTGKKSETLSQCYRFMVADSSLSDTAFGRSPTFGNTSGRHNILWLIFQQKFTRNGILPGNV